MIKEPGARSPPGKTGLAAKVAMSGSVAEAE